MATNNPKAGETCYYAYLDLVPGALEPTEAIEVSRVSLILVFPAFVRHCWELGSGVSTNKRYIFALEF